MNRRSLLTALGSAAAFTVQASDAEVQAVAGDTAPEGAFEIVAEFAGAAPSGIAVTPDGRLFVSLPRYAESHREPTLAEIRAGKLVPFPSAAMSLPSQAPAASRLLSIQGLTLDNRGRLWAIDTGKLAAGRSPPAAPSSWASTRRAAT